MPLLMKSMLESRLTGKGGNVIGLTIFTAVALAECAFLIYVLVALTRETRRASRRKLTPIATLPRRAKLIDIASATRFRAWGRTGSGRF